MKVTREQSWESWRDELATRFTETHKTVDDVRAFPAGTPKAATLAPSQEQAYAHLEQVLRRFAYWRLGKPDTGLLRGGRRVVGIEVKSGNTQRHTSGISTFRANYAVDDCFVVGGGGVPLDEFLSEPAEYWLGR